MDHFSMETPRRAPPSCDDGSSFAGRQACWSYIRGDVLVFVTDLLYDIRHCRCTGQCNTVHTDQSHHISERRITPCPAHYLSCWQETLVHRHLSDYMADLHPQRKAPSGHKHQNSCCQLVSFPAATQNKAKQSGAECLHGMCAEVVCCTAQEVHSQVAGSRPILSLYTLTCWTRQYMLSLR